VPPGTKTDVHQLSVLSDRDMGFTEFRDDNRQRFMSAFRMQPIFIAVSDQGRYDAEVQRSITLEQLFDPEQRRWERKLRHTLLTDLGHTGWQLASSVSPSRATSCGASPPSAARRSAS
jgi:capsid portal protein